MRTLETRTRTYLRSRDARMALIRCLGCGNYYETSARQARRIRKGETRRLCLDCRPLGEDPVACAEARSEFIRWWLEDSGLTIAELGQVAIAVTAYLPKEIRRSGSEVTPNRRRKRARNAQDDGSDGATRNRGGSASSNSSDSNIGAGSSSVNPEAPFGRGVLRQPRLDVGEAA